MICCFGWWWFGFPQRFCGLSKQLKPQFSVEGFTSELNNNVLSLPSSNSFAAPSVNWFTIGSKDEPEGGTKEKDPVVSLNGKLGHKNVPSASNDKKEKNKAFSFPSESPTGHVKCMSCHISLNFTLNY